MGRAPAPAPVPRPRVEPDPDDPRAALIDALADHDDALLAAYVDDEACVDAARLRTALAEQTATALRASGLCRLGDDRRRRGRVDGRAGRLCCRRRRATTRAPCGGSIFKIERGGAGEKIAYVRMFSGTRAPPRPRATADGADKVTGDQRLRARRLGAPGRGASRRDRQAVGPRRTSRSATRSARRRRRAARTLRAADAGGAWSSRTGPRITSRCAPRWLSSPSRIR